jgi:hypothetical protein
MKEKYRERFEERQVSRSHVLLEFAQWYLVRAKKAMRINYDICIHVDSYAIADINDYHDYVDHDDDSVYYGVSVKNASGVHIYLNIDRVRTIQFLESVIVHELLHIKYPKKSESEIRKLTGKYITKQTGQDVVRQWKSV